jgi:hypothetical protein
VSVQVDLEKQKLQNLREYNDAPQRNLQDLHGSTTKLTSTLSHTLHQGQRRVCVFLKGALAIRSYTCQGPELVHFHRETLLSYVTRITVGSSTDYAHRRAAYLAAGIHLSAAQISVERSRARMIVAKRKHDGNITQQNPF